MTEPLPFRSPLLQDGPRVLVGSFLLSRAALPLPCLFFSSEGDLREKVDFTLCEASQEHQSNIHCILLVTQT